MEKDRPYERMNYNNNSGYLKKYNKIEDHKNWIFDNYIGNPNGGYYPPKMSKGNPFFLSPNYNSSNQFNNIKMSNSVNIKPISMNNNLNANNNMETLYDLNRKEKEIQKSKEKEKYRRDLLNQIEENEKRKKNKKKEIDEENKINEIKNREYLLYKQKQEEEFEKIKKMNKNKKLKSQFNLENEIYDISFYSKKGDNSKEIKTERKFENIIEEARKEKRRERKKEEITKNYNAIIGANYLDMYGEKEELKYYIDREYEDFLDILDDNIKNEKNRELPERLYINNDLRKSYDSIRNKNDKRRFVIYNSHIERNINNKYRSVFENIDDAFDYTKSFKIKMEPKRYFNHDIDILLASYSNMIISNDKSKNNFIKEKIDKLNADIKKEEREEKEKEEKEREQKEREQKEKEKEENKINIKERIVKDELLPIKEKIQENQTTEKLKEDETKNNNEEENFVVRIINEKESNEKENSKEQYEDEKESVFLSEKVKEE